ncbi:MULTISPECIES: type III polyketide synthase [unclassified Arthrobacter]|uniref:type III polyketide synthase n=1 Tax=unclassified Arthrobacter TaxID=235627 RepID=UPI001D13603C|nr:MULTISPECIES: type III polyketide synthase [unclassified Arthrobacter]MCC3291702.1 type III polyketide synthase [Arthrobacter sp. zg-Y1110]MCC3302078.1 type III polyketide synthase [Arthrobacter sp. zg-Y895]UWX85544.1 type III polyketide synthase [Arthrobacter sp. zg-Y1110]
MTVTLRSLETAIPPTVLVQSEVRDTFAAQPGLTRLGERLVRTCFDSAAIDTRRTALAELSLTDTSENPKFYDARSGLLLRPSTKTRNDIFAVEATKLFIEAASKALDACAGIAPSDITHVITVSCTGFFNPGPDYKVTRALGLNPSVQRYHLGFMGCYGAFPAMRAAKSFCEADPGSVVLVVSAELCSLHVRTSNDPDAIMGSSLFADGAAAAIITAREDLPDSGPAIQLDHFETILTPVGEEAMAWNIGDEGFEMVLGTYVPHIIDDHIVGALEPLLAHDASVSSRPYREIEHWAIHPGGRSILDKVEAKLELSEQQLVPARETLRTVGNMSSATVLFVLKYILEQPFSGGNERICSMAFGPGLTVETGLFTRVGGPVQPSAAVSVDLAEPAEAAPAEVPAAV